MSGVGYTLMILLIIAFIVALIKFSRISFKIYSFLIAVLLIYLIILFGHSQTNVKIQMKSALNSLTTKTILSDDSSEQDVKEIVNSKHPLKIEDIRIIDPNSGVDYALNKYRTAYVKINNTNYVVKVVCYMVPVPWVPFEDWQLDEVNKK
jgi:uncharacterized protein YacL